LAPRGTGNALTARALLSLSTGAVCRALDTILVGLANSIAAAQAIPGTTIGVLGFMAAAIRTLNSTVIRAVTGRFRAIRFAFPVSTIADRADRLAGAAHAFFVRLTLPATTSAGVATALRTCAVRDTRTVVFAFALVAHLPVGTVAASPSASVGAAVEARAVLSTVLSYATLSVAGKPVLTFATRATTIVTPAHLPTALRCAALAFGTYTPART